MPVLANGPSQMFNLCLSLEKFPEIWKMARVTPIYKDGSQNEISNYRPISVLPAVSRLLKKLVCDQLYTYLNSNTLKVYGLSGKEITWFELYLGNHKQCCTVYGQTYNLQPIKSGVPQGSCLGPLLFLIYINDLPLKLNASVASMYADDISIFFSSNSISNINNVVNKDLESLKTWHEENKVSLNVTKHIAS